MRLEVWRTEFWYFAHTRAGGMSLGGYLAWQRAEP